MRFEVPHFLVGLNRFQKKTILLASDALLLPLALWSSIALLCRFMFGGVSGKGI